MNPNLIKIAAFVAAGAISSLVYLAIPELDFWDPLLSTLAGTLIGWAGFKRPGDAGK